MAARRGASRPLALRAGARCAVAVLRRSAVGSAAACGAWLPEPAAACVRSPRVKGQGFCKFVEGNLVSRILNSMDPVFIPKVFIPKVYETCPVVGWSFVP